MNTHSTARTYTVTTNPAITHRLTLSGRQAPHDLQLGTCSGCFWQHATLHTDPQIARKVIRRAFTHHLTSAVR